MEAQPYPSKVQGTRIWGHVYREHEFAAPQLLNTFLSSHFHREANEVPVHLLNTSLFTCLYCPCLSPRNLSIHMCHMCAFYCVSTCAHQVVLLEIHCHRQSLRDPLLLNPALPSTTLSHPWRMTRECWQPRELRNPQDHLRSHPSLIYHHSSSG